MRKYTHVYLFRRFMGYGILLVCPSSMRKASVAVSRLILQTKPGPGKQMVVEQKDPQDPYRRFPSLYPVPPTLGLTSPWGLTSLLQSQAHPYKKVKPRSKRKAPLCPLGNACPEDQRNTPTLFLVDTEVGPVSWAPPGLKIKSLVVEQGGRVEVVQEESPWP